MLPARLQRWLSGDGRECPSTEDWASSSDQESLHKNVAIIPQNHGTAMNWRVWRGKFSKIGRWLLAREMIHKLRSYHHRLASDRTSESAVSDRYMRSIRVSNHDEAVAALSKVYKILSVAETRDGSALNPNQGQQD